MRGRRIGAYTVVDEIGRGGMGVVYTVRHPEQPRLLAMKLILPVASHAEALARFIQEAELLARVRHPGVVAVHELGAVEQGTFIVTEFVEGRTLQEHLHTGGAFEPRRAAHVARALADVLAVLHPKGILHRDLKPHNVILRTDGQPVLLDFGIAKDLEGERLTQTGVSLGTPAFASPEQAGGEPVDARTDVYGLGATLYALLAARPPFEGQGISLVAKVLEQEPSWDLPVPRGLLAVVQRAMAKAPDDRYASATELRDALDAWLRAAPSSERRGWLGPLVAATVCAGLLVGLGYSLAGRAAPADPPPGDESDPPAVVSSAEPATDDPPKAETVDPIRATLRGKSWREHVYAVRHAPAEEVGYVDDTTGRAAHREIRARFVDDERFLTYGSKRITLWTLRSAEPLQRFELAGATVYSLAVSADGRRAVGGVSNQVLELNLEDGTTQPIVTGLPQPPTAVALSPDGTNLAYAHHHTLRLRRGLDDEAVLAKHPRWILRLLFSRDGTRLLAGSGGSFEKQSTLSLHEVPSGELIHEADPGSKPRALAHSRDGERFAWGTNLRRLGLWSKDGDPVPGFAEPERGMMSEGAYSGLAFSPDGALLYVTSGDDRLPRWQLEVLDARTGKRLEGLTFKLPFAMSLDVSPDGLLLLTGMSDGSVRVWRAYR